MGVVSKILSRKQSDLLAKTHRAIESLPEFSGIFFTDIGSAGGITPRWEMFSRFLHYTGFDPDVSSKQSEEKKFLSCKVMNDAIWNTNIQKVFNVCRKRDLSSFFSPNFEILEKFPNSERFLVENNTKIDCITLDATSTTEIDFLKIDIQGGELYAIEGGKDKLRDCMGIELEIEFLEVYIGQPDIGKVFEELKNQEFEFYDFVNLYRWPRTRDKKLGQMIFCDALFLKNPEIFMQGKPSINQISRYIAILLIYNRFDLIEFLFLIFEREEITVYSKFSKYFFVCKREFIKLNQILQYINWLLKNIKPEYQIHFLH